MKVKAAHHRGAHQRRAKLVCDWAWAHPDTRCARCGLTYAEAAKRWGQARAKWTGGHVNDGEINGAYQPEHLHCGSSAGATYGNAQRRTSSPQW